MSEAAIKLSELQQRVAGRKQLLALQDRLAIVLLIGGLLTAGFVLMERLLLLRPVYWVIFAVILAALVAAFAFDWYRTRTTKKEAAFLIDDAFDLEDRVSTAHAIIARGQTERAVEAALLEDAATRIADKHARAIVPYRVRSWHALSIVGIAALVAAFMIPERVLPGGEAMIEARADIQNAGEQLEDVGEKIAQIAPSESQTAKLAKEQAELGRSLRRMPLSRAEALQKLSALEDRIRQRHSELANTRADEIVSIAEKRLGAALQPKSKTPQEKAVTDGEQRDALAAEPDAQNETADAKAAPDAKATPRGSSNRGKNQSSGKATEKQIAKSDAASRSNANRADISDPTTATKPRVNDTKQAGPPTEPSKANSNQAQATATGEAQKPASEPNAQQPNTQPSNAQATSANPSNPPPSQQKPDANDQQAKNNANPTPPSADAKSADPNAANKQADGQPSADQNQPNGEPKPEASKDSNNSMTGMMAEQAAKVLPQMSADLLKKAAELRAGKLTADDLKGLQQSAEMLARDLSKIAQSKELQQAAEQLARQITPEMIEQFARSLGNLEQLKQELQASAQLLMQNQQAKSMVAGLAQKFAKIGEEFGKGERNQNRDRQRSNDENNSQADNPQGNNPQGNPTRASRGKGQPDDPQGRAIVRASGGLTQRTGEPLQRTGRGVETKLSGNPTRGTGGDYLFLKSQARGGVARAPYSSAYPQYRREAERTVERSQVPPHLRSVVRGYFDAINPDGTRKP
jgi:hypothetical protein